jgi:hypothetical protein
MCSAKREDPVKLKKMRYERIEGQNGKKIIKKLEEFR